MYGTMAPDSKSMKPSSSRIGTCPKGCMARYSGLSCSPLSEQAAFMGNPASSSAQADPQIAELTLDKLGNPISPKPAPRV
jgi:hypothetical protein